MRPFPREVTGRRETHLRLEGVLSRSDSSAVFSGLLLDGPEPIPVAVKEGPNLIREVETLRAIGAHPNVVHLIEVTYEEEGKPLALFELCRGSLKDVAPLEGHRVKVLVEELLRVVRFFHEQKKIVHGALRADHLLLSKGGQVKVCSFSEAAPCLNINHLRPDLQGMGLSIVQAAIGSQTEVESEIAIQNPRYLVRFVSRASTLSKSDSIILASMLNPLLQGHVQARNLEKHIFLQEPDQVLRFIDGCKDFLMSRRMPSANSRLERMQSKVVGHDWHRQGHLETMKEGRRYDHTIKDLLRLMRNKSEHYCSMPSYIKECLDHPLVDPGSFLQYFTALFPGLIVWTWHSMYESRLEANLQAFYPEDGAYIARVPIEEMLEELV